MADDPLLTVWHGVIQVLARSAPLSAGDMALLCGCLLARFCLARDLTPAQRQHLLQQVREATDLFCDPEMRRL
jgi:hypothetical protein